MKALLDFEVMGKPIPQGSKRAFVVNGKAVIADVKSTELKRWRKEISATAVGARLERGALLIDAAVWVRLTFRMQRPASVKREWPSVAPDVDKLTRAVLDALTGSVFQDDSRVVSITATKTYAESSSISVFPAHSGVRIEVGLMPGEKEQ